jgi:dipeptidyl aminopeptidase/acylaminoacyl peptidase
MKAFPLSMFPPTTSALVVHSQTNVVWDLGTKKILHRFDPKDSAWGGFSPDGQKLLVKLNNKIGIRVWDLDQKLETRHWVAELEPDDQIFRLCYSPDGKMLVVLGNKETIRLLETATGKERLKLPGAPSSIADHNVAFSANGTMLAVGFENATVRLYDVRDGKQLQVFAGHIGPVTSVNFSPDSSRLVSGSEDTTALVWEIPVACRDRKPELVKLGREERDKLWEKLANADVAKAYAALQILAASPAETVPLCELRLFETPPTPPEQIQRWILQLDNEEFAVREQGSQNLERLGREAGVALEKALQGDCSPEMRRRIEVLLETLKGKQVPIRVVRVVELLEQIGTPEAADVLRQLEKKTGDAGVRDDVRRSLCRLAAKPKVS